MNHLVENFRERLAKQANKENAVQMSAYMKNHFPFFGIKTPERRQISKQFFQDYGLLKESFNEKFVLCLWEQPEREFQMIALDYIAKYIKKLERPDIELMQTLITTKSWWDSVDMLAQHPVGTIVAAHPELIQDRIEKWAVSEDMWLRRTAILFQLRYKEKTNEELLYRYINLNSDSKEFFIQKAIGWALREYSKTNPDSVRHFINNNLLAPLSVREGSKHLSKE